MSGPMQIESIAVKNYRCLRDSALNDLSRLTVLVGANGSGKSSLIDVFAFLKDALTENVSSAAARRGDIASWSAADRRGRLRSQ